MTTTNTELLLAFVSKFQLFNCDFLDCAPDATPESREEHEYRLRVMAEAEGDAAVQAAVLDAEAWEASYQYYVERFYDARQRLASDALDAG